MSVSGPKACLSDRRVLLLLSATAYTRLRVVDRAHESFGDVAMGRIDASLASEDRRPMVVVMEIDRRNIAMPLILAGGARGDSASLRPSS